MRFLTKETFKAPPTAEVQALIPAEQAKVKELTEQGMIEAVYVAADQSSAWMVWNVDSQAALEETHNTLPLHPHMNSEITVLSEEM
jgi:muconolactone delta-isomerase